MTGGSDSYVYNYFAEPAESGVYRMGYKVEKSETENFVYSHDHRVFVGPKIRKDLALRSDNLELAIDMGWFWFISQPMVWILDKINDFVGNWGLSIVLFTILLKLLLWPVTAKGFSSMANMRRVQGPMKEIQERYKNDKQKLSQEMMALYKKEGANPLGGCLPMLAQVPFFIGFFFALREMVELRHASFGFWIGDLSVPDPLFVLPVAFGLIMVLTQRLNPAPPVQDPTQAQVMKYMPVMFSFMFVIFPAGLCLYSVVNSGVSLDASLGLWIGDLSVPDPLFILPVAFGLIMVLTQKLNPAPPVQDPTQAQIMQYMPVMFSFMFVIFPAGLCLYSVVNSPTKNYI